MGAQVVRFVAIAPFLVALMISSGTSLSCRSLELALVVLKCKTKRPVFIVVCGAALWELHLWIAGILASTFWPTFVRRSVRLRLLFRPAT